MKGSGKNSRRGSGSLRGRIVRRLLKGLALSLIAVAVKGDSMFAFNEIDGARVRVTIDPTRASDYVVPEELFGTFTEVLGRNTYHGFWAQLFGNPSLEPIAGCLKKQAGNRQMDLPFAWQRWNGADTGYELVEDAFNTAFAQRLRVRSIPEGSMGAGIRQELHLPVHRQERYELSLYVKDATAPLVAAVRSPGQSGQILAQVRIVADRPDRWRKVTAVLQLDVSPEHRRSTKPLWFCLGLVRPGTVLLDQVTLWHADHIEGFDPDVIRVLKDGSTSMLRFPGGNYASGYHWKDDLSPLDERPTKPNPAWNICDPHHVGTDEHIRLCRLLGAEPLICVNAGNGTAQEAADWVEYCNGTADTRWGRVRAERGHKEPYNVRYWEIGNELWGSWQIGHCGPEEYAERYRAFRTAMLARGSSLKIIACGHQDWEDPSWNQVLFDRCGDILETASLHFLFANDRDASPVSSFLSQMGYSHHFEAFIRRQDARARARGLSCRFAITELMEIGRGLPYQPHPGTQAEVLFFAGTLNACIRTEGMVELITYSALLNHGGGPRKEAARVFATPVHHARRALRRLIGGRPLACSVDGPFEDVPEWQSRWAGPDPRRFPLVDALPILHPDRVDLVLLNRDPERTFNLEIDTGMLRCRGDLDILEIAGASFMAQNSLQDPDRVAPRKRREKWPPTGRPVTIQVKPASFLLIALPLAEPAVPGPVRQPKAGIRRQGMPAPQTNPSPGPGETP